MAPKAPTERGSSIPTWSGVNEEILNISDDAQGVILDRMEFVCGGVQATVFRSGSELLLEMRIGGMNSWKVPPSALKDVAALAGRLDELVPLLKSICGV